MSRILSKPSGVPPVIVRLMNIFEFRFNLKEKEDSVFNSFCYEPVNVYEKRLGSLLLIGEVKNALPINLKFLDNLAVFIKKEYYASPIRRSPEVSLKESLKKANEYLEAIAKKGDVSWLGNLNIAVLSFIPHQKDRWQTFFTKVGDLKILLSRTGEILDIGKNLDLEDIEPYPLKIFGNIVTGKLNEGDLIFAFTKEVFSVFAEGSVLTDKISQKAGKGKNPFKLGSLLEKIAKLEKFEAKKLGEFLETKKRELSQISGVCLLCRLSKKTERTAEDKKTLAFETKEKFSMQKLFLSPIIKIFKKRRGFKPKIPKIQFSQNLKKNLILVLALVFFLLLGFLIFRK